MMYADYYIETIYFVVQLFLQDFLWGSIPDLNQCIDYVLIMPSKKILVFWMSTCNILSMVTNICQCRRHSVSYI